jgi:dTDP-4-amino-4,6-dideoxygalactose transaminase
LALRALGLPPGARALIPALTFPATASAALAAGLVPVFTDVDPDSWMLTPAIAAAALDEIAVVVPVATYGAPLPAAEWDDFVRHTAIPVVMDAAGAFLRQDMPQRCAVAFSFHATKTFGIGEGGLVASHDQDLIAQVVRLSNFGFRAGRAEVAAGNAKLSEYHAAVGLAQVARIPTLRERHARVLAVYREHLPPLQTQAGTPGVLAVRVTDAGAAGEILARSGVETRRWYQPALPRHPAFAGVSAARGLDVCASLDGRLLGLPFHNFLDAQEVRHVCTQLSALTGTDDTRPGSCASL